jgi:hypothetical protein
MTDHKQRIKAAYLRLSAYYQQQLDDHVFEMYAEDLADLDPKAVIWAMNKWRLTPAKGRPPRLPMPAELRELVEPSVVDDDSIARDTAARIVGAVPRYGYTNPALARAAIGEVGWTAVQRSGG